MIDNVTKKQFLRELEKTGNVYFSCQKTGISRATVYRWKDNDRDFRARLRKSLRCGRDNMNDIAEHVLGLKIKEKDTNAIKYWLSHNHPNYRLKRHKIVMEHHRVMPPMENQVDPLEKLFHRLGMYDEPTKDDGVEK